MLHTRSSRPRFLLVAAANLTVNKTPSATRRLHSHVAKLPPDPRESRAHTPETIAKILLKLLAKNAEDRYQSALGLSHDLVRCLALAEKGEAIVLAKLGSRDVSARLNIPETLYGREIELQALLAAFERASEGNCELAVVTGAPGILDSVTIVGADYVHNSVNLYFRPSQASHNTSALVSAACTHLGFAPPTATAQAHASKTGCIAVTYGWDNPSIERICFYVAGFAREDVPDYDPQLRTFARNAPALVDDPRFIIGWSHGARGTYLKIEDDYTGDVSEVFGAAMAVAKIELADDCWTPTALDASASTARAKNAPPPPESEAKHPPVTSNTQSPAFVRADRQRSNATRSTLHTPAKSRVSDLRASAPAFSEAPLSNSTIKLIADSMTLSR